MDRTGLAAALLVACTVVWGSNVVVGRAVAFEVPPVGLAFWRNVFALLVILPFTARELWRSRAALRAGLGTLCATALVGTALFNAVVYWALETTTAINAALMMTLVPVVVPAMAFFLVDERLSGRQALGIVLSLLGVTFVITRGELEVLRTLSFVAGDLLMFIAMLCWSLYSVVIKRKPDAIGSDAFLTAVIAVATATLLPFYLWESAAGRPFPFEAGAITAAAYVGVFPTALALLVFNRAVLILGANRTAPFNHLVPVFATVLAILFLDERLALFHAVGAGLIATGLAVSTARPKPARGGAAA